MTEVATRGPRAGSTDGPQPVRRRRTLPSGRAVVGAFLIVAAMVGTFSAYTSASAPPTTRYVVAARDLGPGDTVAAADLVLVAIALPDAQRRRSFDVVEPLVGLTVVEPILAGEILQEGAVAPTGSAGSRTVSFAVPRSRAVDGAVRPGERVDVVATFGSSGKSCTHLVSSDVVVTAVSGGTVGVAGSADLTVTVAVDDPEDELAVAHAAAAGTLTLVRTTGADEAAATTRVCSPGAQPDVDPGSG